MKTSFHMKCSSVFITRPTIDGIYSAQLTDWLTDSMEHSHSWESGREIPLAACPYPEPDQYSPCPSLYLMKINFNIILRSTPKFPSGHFPSGSGQLTALLNLDEMYLACGYILQTGYLSPCSCNPVNLKRNSRSLTRRLLLNDTHSSSSHFFHSFVNIRMAFI
jgi:hypothetical protein